MSIIKKYTQFITERYDINNIPNNIVLLSLLYGKAGKFFLYDTLNKKVIGFIVFDDYVDRVFTENGYGAFLYETALTYRYPDGLSMSRDGSTSDDAINVWEKFLKRNDVIKKRLYSTEPSFKKTSKEFIKKYTPERAKQILELEDTKFYFSYGKDKLDTLIEKGKEYMLNNNISDVDLDNMEINIDFND